MQLSSRPGRILRCHLLSMLLLIGAAVLLLAQSPVPKAPAKDAPKLEAAAAAPAGIPELTAGDVGAFLDGLVPLQLAREDIAGAVVVVVKEDKILFSKGYGYSDVEKKAPVSPEGTLFRPGSVSKLFTWTAVMQLVEQGKLDLDRDVNQYLDFKLSASQPITLRNILTHTPGYEEVVKDLFIDDEKNIKSLREYLTTHEPEQIFAPGTTPAYCNYATALAGYIVQRVSGQPFDDYIEQHIFQPLDMPHCTFRQPLPDALKPMMSRGYIQGSDPAKEFEIVQAWPAGSSSMTGAEIAHFIIAHLHDGEYQGKQILKPETARLMHSRAYTNIPEMNGMALGFYEESRNGHRIIGHGGDTMYFHSDLHVMQDAGVGFFVSYNSAGKGEERPRSWLWQKFLDRYFPYEPPAPAAGLNPKEDAKQVAGSYLVSRRAESNFIKVGNAFGLVQIEAGDDGTISCGLLKDLNGKPKKYREVAPLRFRDVNGQDQVAFKKDGEAPLRLIIDFPFMVFDKVPWYQHSWFNLTIAIGSLAILVLSLLLWPVNYFLRRHYGKQLELSTGQRRLRLLTRVGVLLNLGFAVAFGLLFTSAMKNIGMMTPKLDPKIHLIQVVGILGALATVAAILHAWRSWANSSEWFWGRLGNWLVALAFIGFAWFAVHFNLLNMSLRY